MYNPCILIQKLSGTWAAPVIIFGMKSLWPGASISVITLVVVSNFVIPTSIVTPLKENKMVRIHYRNNQCYSELNYLITQAK